MEGSKLKVDEFLTHIKNEEQEYSLLLGDIDRIHDYIFETSNLAEVRGGSQLITLLITEKFEKIFGEFFNDLTHKKEFEKNKNNGFRIYNNAGSCMIIIPTNKIKEFTTAINKEFYQKTGIVTITCATAPIQNDKPQNHITLIKFLRSQIAIKKKKKSFFPFIESSLIVERCDSCGKRPAAIKSNRTFKYLCSICYKKDQNREKSIPIKKLDLKGYTLPEDLDNLAGTSNYIALLYADGNEMGKAVFKSENLNKFRELSQNIEKELKNSIKSSIDPILKDNHKKLPFEILNMAGDDILMFIQGKYLFDFSLHLLETFQESCGEILDNPTMSLGATIFRKTYPIQYAFYITNSLLKSAKYFAKKQEKSESALSYIYLKAPIAMYSSEELLEYHYMSQHNVRLTMRPFTLTQFKKLREIAGNVKKILPSSQREAILRSFDEKSLKATMNFIKYQISGMTNGEDFLNEIKKLKEIFELNDLDGSNELPIWGKRETKGQKVHTTPLLDLLELLEIEGGTHA
jgi:hypothetical protein